MRRWLIRLVKYVNSHHTNDGFWTVKTNVQSISVCQLAITLNINITEAFALRTERPLVENRYEKDLVKNLKRSIHFNEKSVLEVNLFYTQICWLHRVYLNYREVTWLNISAKRFTGLISWFLHPVPTENKMQIYPIRQSNSLERKVSTALGRCI